MRLWRVLVILAACAVTVLGQTFQYSRGWTNGRKRAESPLVEDDIAASPCQIRRLRMLLQGRPVSQLFVPCEMWQQQGDTNDAISSRNRLRHLQQVGGSSSEVDTDM